MSEPICFCDYCRKQRSDRFVDSNRPMNNRLISKLGCQ